MVGAYKQPRRRDAGRTRSTPDAGEVRWGHDASVGYFAQDHHEALGETAKGTTPYEWLYRFDTRRPQEEIRAILGRLLFSGDSALKPTEALSRRRGGAAAPRQDGPRAAQRPRARRADQPPRHRVDRGAARGAAQVRGDGHLRQPRPPLRVRAWRRASSSCATAPRRRRGAGCEVVEFSGAYEEYLERESGSAPASRSAGARASLQPSTCSAPRPACGPRGRRPLRAGRCLRSFRRRAAPRARTPSRR